MLTRLTVRGFKSFADATTLHMREGINVIVGPNGSGKSNLAEAILWALGEQRAGRLRAGGMADVLYAGGDRRPVAPLAEVTLALGEAPGADGVERPAITASRRLSRAGDAVYRLGDGACRLLDVQEALATRGLGPDALAVIRQGQVEALCTSTPPQRRAMVDAAAGVAVAKRRRRRAEQKLVRVDERLVRARDLAGEVDGRLRTLDRQARAAERAAELDRQIAAARDALSAAQARAAAAALAAARERSERCAERSAAAERQVVAAREAVERARVDHEQANRVAAAESGRVGWLRSGIERLAGRLELATERVAAAERSYAQRVRRRQEARDRLGELHRLVAGADRERQQAIERATAADRAAQAAEADDLRARGERRQAEDQMGAAQAAADAAERAADQCDQAYARACDQVGRLSAMGGSDEALEARRQRVARAERREEISRARLERTAPRLQAVRTQVADRAAEREDAEQRVRALRSRVASLAPPRGDRTPRTSRVGDGLMVEPGAERAVNAALGHRLGAIWSADLASACAALDAGEAGAAVPGSQAELRAEASSGPEGAVCLWELVRECPASAVPHLAPILRAAYLVDDLSRAPIGSAGLLVDRQGRALECATGIVTQPGAEWVRQAAHARAEAELAEGRVLAEAATADARAAAAQASRIEARARAVERAVRRSAQAAREARQQHERLLAQRAEGAAQLARAEVDRESLAAQREPARARATAARAQWQRLSEDIEPVRHAARSAEVSARTAAEEAAAARAHRAAAQARHAEACARLESTMGAAEVVVSNGHARELGRRAQAAMGVAQEALVPLRERAERRRDQARAHAAQLQRGLAEVGRAAAAAEAHASEAAQQAHAAAVDEAVASERASEAGVVPDGADEGLSIGDAAESLGRLERARASLGAVNALAAAERAELAERHDEMALQIDDLERTAADLRRHMVELEAAVAEGFEALFGSLSARFEEVCGLLFPGGRGRLRAVADAEGEAGIEVEVVPAGKRPRSLALLSGGERSLVALAFCLALAMARPAPFYLLDEVEAALDDVNLRRFLRVVRRLADGGRQFVLITHQQPTVEIADTLFGVTMGAEGVSQVVARRLAGVAGTQSVAAQGQGALRALPGGRGR